MKTGRYDGCVGHTRTFQMTMSLWYKISGTLPASTKSYHSITSFPKIHIGTLTLSYQSLPT